MLAVPVTYWFLNNIIDLDFFFWHSARYISFLMQDGQIQKYFCLESSAIVSSFPPEACCLVSLTGDWGQLPTLVLKENSRKSKTKITLWSRFT